MGSTNFKAADGIIKLQKNESLIIKYLEKSPLSVNYMNNRCTKVLIPGKEIGQNSSFYIYNIEGFLDIEKGIYSSLIQLFETMKILKENNISIKTYEDLEKKANNILSAIRIVNCFANYCISRDGNSLEQEQKCQCTEKTEKIEEKKSEGFNFNLGNLSFSWFKTEEKSQEQINQVIEKEDQEKFIEGIKNIDFNSIGSYISLALAIMEVIKHLNIPTNQGISNAINWLSNKISFNELNELINCSLRVVAGSISGISHIAEGINDFPKKKFVSIINLATGVLEIGKVGLDIINTSKKVENIRNGEKYTKAQENLLSLVNKMEGLFKKLINSNLEEFKNNNIIILGIDESDSFYNEEVDLQLFNINNIDTYAQCISEKEKDRAKYIKNMIYFYQKILPKFSELTEKNEKDKNQKLDFFLSLQDFIISNCNNQDFWINLSQDNIVKFVDHMEKGYNYSKNYFKNNSCEIKDKFFQTFGKKSNVENKEGKPPAPITENENRN